MSCNVFPDSLLSDFSWIMSAFFLDYMRHFSWIRLSAFFLDYVVAYYIWINMSDFSLIT